MLATNTCTTADCTLESIQETIGSLPPPDPRGSPTILVRSVERFRKDIGAMAYSTALCYGGIPVRVSIEPPDDAICLVEWRRPGDHEPYETQVIRRPNQDPAAPRGESGHPE